MRACGLRGEAGPHPWGFGKALMGLLRRATAVGQGSTEQQARTQARHPRSPGPCILASHNTMLHLRPKTPEDVLIYCHDFSLSENSTPHLSHHEIRVNDSNAEFMNLPRASQKSRWTAHGSYSAQPHGRGKRVQEEFQPQPQ